MVTVPMANQVTPLEIPGRLQRIADRVSHYLVFPWSVPNRVRLVLIFPLFMNASFPYTKYDETNQCSRK
jgi:hypothetical protein